MIGYLIPVGALFLPPVENMLLSRIRCARTGNDEMLTRYIAET